MTLHDESEDPFGSSKSRMMRGLAYPVTEDFEPARADLESYAAWADEVGAPIVTAHANDGPAVWSVVSGQATDDDRLRILSAIEGFRSIPNDACLCHTIHVAAMYMASRGARKMPRDVWGLSKASDNNSDWYCHPTTIEHSGLRTLDWTSSLMKHEQNAKRRAAHSIRKQVSNG